MAETRKSLTGTKVLEAARKVSDIHGYDICEDGLKDLTDALGLDYTPPETTWCVEVRSLYFDFKGNEKEALDAVYETVGKALNEKFGKSAVFTTYDIYEN